MQGSVTTSIRIDRQLKREADALFADLGMSFSTAVNTFLRQTVREQGMPFRITRDVPNAETRAAMEEAERIAADHDYQGAASMEEFIAAMDA